MRILLFCAVLFWRTEANAQAWPNEPPGSTLISENNWENSPFPCAGCPDAKGWIDQYGTTIASSPLGLTPPGGSRVLQAHWVTTQPPDTTSIKVWKLIPQTREIYTAFWFMYNSGFRETTGAGSKGTVPVVVEN